jgi:TPR repeat protein
MLSLLSQGLNLATSFANIVATQSNPEGEIKIVNNNKFVGDQLVSIPEAGINNVLVRAGGSADFTVRPGNYTVHFATASDHYPLSQESVSLPDNQVFTITLIQPDPAWIKKWEEENAKILRDYVEYPQKLADAKATYKRGDYATALQLFLAIGDDLEAQGYIASMYYFGKGIQKDYAQAAAWYLKAANRHDSIPVQQTIIAQLQLGWMYYYGQGVAKDYAQAAAWYLKAANNDNVDAQYWLAWMYYLGEGVPQDYAQAAAWYLKAAKQFDRDAEYALGFLYYKGQGVPKDYAQSADWMEQAANDGDVKAQLFLANLYCEDEMHDYVGAYVWFTVVASDSSPAEKDLKDEANADRAKLEQKMTSTEIAKAKKLASEQAIRWLSPRR